MKWAAQAPFLLLPREKFMWFLLLTNPSKMLQNNVFQHTHIENQLVHIAAKPILLKTIVLLLTQAVQTHKRLTLK